MQGRSKLFEGGVAKVYIPHVVSIGGHGGMLPQENFVKLDTMKVLLRPCLASNPNTTFKHCLFVSETCTMMGSRFLRCVLKLHMHVCI